MLSFKIIVEIVRDKVEYKKIVAVSETNHRLFAWLQVHALAMIIIIELIETVSHVV